jgi:hypothetical protein
VLALRAVKLDRLDHIGNPLPRLSERKRADVEQELP